MKFGVGIPTCGEGLFYPVGFASPSIFVSITCRAEELGYDSVWGNDHVVTPPPVRKKGEYPNFFEPLVLFAYLASQTERIKLGIGLIVAPLRDPVILAKQALTLDQLSRGRFVLGVGLGAYREEFESLGGKGRRGEILNEFISALNLLFSNRAKVSFKGHHYDFKDVEMFPKPLSVPFPLHIGGNSTSVLRRVARWGRGWMPSSLSPDDLSVSFQELSQYVQEEGRSMSNIEILPHSICALARDSKAARKQFLDSLIYQHVVHLQRSRRGDRLTDDVLIQRNLIGSPEVIIRKIEAYKRLGVRQLWFDFVASRVDQLMEQMELFAREVAPLFQ